MRSCRTAVPLALLATSSLVLAGCGGGDDDERCRRAAEAQDVAGERRARADLAADRPRRSTGDASAARSTR